MTPIFLDTNIFIRFLTNDDTNKAQDCLELFEEIEKRTITVTTSPTNISEICYILTSNKAGYNFSHEQVSDVLLPLLKLKNLKFEEKALCIEALNFFSSDNSLDFEDAYAIANMRSAKIDTIVSYDSDFNHMEDIKRVEPKELLTNLAV